MLLTKPFEFLSRRGRRQKSRRRQANQQRNSGYGRKLAAESLEERNLLSASPQMLLDINTNTLASQPSDLVDVGSTAFFNATEATHGRELWKSDGTEAGTLLVKDILPGSEASNPSNLTDVNGTLFFTANSDPTSPAQTTSTTKNFG